MGYGEKFHAVVLYTIAVNVVGSGQPLLVVHGGPGMSHDYLAPQLIESFKDAYQLIFMIKKEAEASL